MHIVLEGIVPHVSGLFLKRCIVELGLFSVHVLNEALNNYTYSYIDSSNTPQPIDRDVLVSTSYVKQKAVAMLTFVHVLPYIIGHYFEQNDPYYRNWINMAQIVNLCMSPYADENTAGDLEQLVMTFLYEYKALYPTVSVRPKMHYLCHMVQQILDFGPLRLTSTLRFEAKHGWFKDFRWKNFKNISYSMAQKHQLNMASRMTDFQGKLNSKFVTMGDEIGEGVVISIHDNSVTILRNLLRHHNVQTDEVYVTSVMTIEGLTYKTGAVLLWKWSETDVPKFVVIDQMYVMNGNDKYFVCRHLRTGPFVWTYNSYEVSESLKYRLVMLADLINKWPLDLVLINNQKFVANRFCHFSNGPCSN
jgi:hypothetical protein